MPAKLDRKSWQALHSSLSPRRTSYLSLGVLASDVLLGASAHELAQADSLAARLVAPLLLALSLLHFYLLHHECVHAAIFVRASRNAWLGHALGFVLLYPFLQRRRSHRLHHSWTGHLDQDPTNARARAKLSALTPRALRGIDRLWRAWIPLLAFNERVGLWIEPFRHPRGTPGFAHERVACGLYLAGYVVVGAAFAYRGEVGLWVRLYLPAFVLLLVLEELINLPHHVHAPHVSRRLLPWEQMEVTDSCTHVRVWSSAVLLNFHLHTAHHLFPQLSWHDLPRAQQALHGYELRPAESSELSVALRLRSTPFARVFAPYLSSQSSARVGSKPEPAESPESSG